MVATTSEPIQDTFQEKSCTESSTRPSLDKVISCGLEGVAADHDGTGSSTGACLGWPRRKRMAAVTAETKKSATQSKERWLGANREDNTGLRVQKVEETKSAGRAQGTWWKNHNAGRI